MDRKVTPYSGLKIFSHHDKLKSIKEGKRTAPLYVRLKPTNLCNHHCYYCSYADSELGLRDSVSPKDQIPWERMRELINDLGEIGVRAVTFSGGGEPLVYPYIVQSMKMLLDEGIDLSIITNGQFLNGEIAEVLTNAKWVRISLDSARAETYSQIRKIPINAFHKVWENIKKFSSIKPASCELGINFVINHENADQVYDAACMAYEHGANHIKFAARITKDVEQYHMSFRDKVVDQLHRVEKEFTDKKFSIINKYEEDFELSTAFERNYSKCFVKEAVCAIAADSKVYFCHDKAYVKSGVVGDLAKSTFKEIWFAPEVQDRYRNFDPRKECNHHCVYDDRNILLNSYFSLDENHINFI
ncbi:MAG: radical SAM protein [Clostridia bacterium]|nr:radical SAM protein [Clostridia bacterium]